MKLAISNIAIPDDIKTQVYDKMMALGYTGLEIAPTKLLGANPYEKLDDARKAAKELKERYGFSIPSMQSIWFGQTGNIFDIEDAEKLKSYTEKAILFAACVECKSLVFGCPKNRNIPKGEKEESALNFFKHISKNAAENNTAIALEANVPEYGTNFINTSAQAFDFAKRIPNLKVNYDFGTVIGCDEDLSVLRENIGLVSHIHISELNLAPILRRDKHKELAELLKELNYVGFVSIEMKETDKQSLFNILEYIAEVFV